MKKVIFQMSVSLDGYFEGPNGELDWHVVDEEFNDFAIETLKATEVLIMGRKVYELMASYWPNAPEDSGVRDLMNGTPKLVFSRTLNEVPWENSRLAAGSIAEEVAPLRQMPGNGLLGLGGSCLAESFLDLGLIDEIRLIVTPVLLGAGRTVFDGISKRCHLKPLSTKQFDSGNLLLTYTPEYN